MKKNADGPCSSAATFSLQGHACGNRLPIQDEMHAVLEYLAVEFHKQLQYAGRELNQTQELLNDAIGTLTACFAAIHRNVDAVIEDVEDLAAARDETEAVEKRLNISSQLQADLHIAIRTLQFQDLTSQSIAHATLRVSAMKDVLSDIRSRLEQGRGDSANSMHDLYRCKESILQAVVNLDEHKTNPVSQGHMGVGEIELF